MLLPEHFIHFGEKYHISENFFWYIRKIFFIFRKKTCYILKIFLVCPKTIFEIKSPPPLPPPVANISGKKFLDVLFYSKSAPQSLPPQLLEPSYAPAHRRTGAWGNISRSRKKFARRNLKEVAKTSSPRSKWRIDFLCYDFN
jgi:hypothetical protein